MIKILLVEDQEIIRFGIKQLLKKVPGLKVIGEASNGVDALRLSKELNPDVVVTDIKMPSMGGLEASRKMLRYNPDLKILALTIYDHEPYPSLFLEAGVAGYLTKGCTANEMVSAIRQIHSGQRYLSDDIAQRLAIRPYAKGEKSILHGLSERELEVMRMITSGATRHDISKKLSLSPKTINSYRYRIFEKLGVTSDIELTLLAMRLNITEKDMITS